ncbi:S8 family peptidase [Kribbella solani]|uniref:Peptidase S8/S53 domain-containing protein n=1 Tax=Kribbella solani TaxID=236067 RepID=A0A841DKJ8_9ACTN|nr:S8 family peptidase [Kribbella solani]MBB5977306.1 hypothetical protein [Kribbella solani]
MRVLRSRVVRLGLAVALVAAVGLAVSSDPRVADARDSGAATTAWTRTNMAGEQVTLVTGDRVLFDVRGSKVLSVHLSRPGGVSSFVKYQRDGDWYVLPMSVADLVSSGQLDEQLFNITGLIRQGYGDQKSSDVPVLVQYSNVAATKSAPSGARRERRLPALKLAAIDAPKQVAGRVWEQLTKPVARGQRVLAAGTQRIWLNARVRADLDRSVPQIGAPAAWQAGFTGRQVRVAVLDTGIDAAHPDLAGKVAVAKNFTDTADVGDHVGHGTHVAGTIAGSGSASGGKYRGVAPDARLVIGKVLDDTGTGQLDDLLAGMQWAVTEAHAKIVNLSLGGRGDGTDPVAQAVDQLSGQYGVLFVAAAGNDGPGRGTLHTPGVAAAALTVGAVDAEDVLTEFSSRGPGLPGSSVKPEIVAPGDQIVAARAAGTLGRWAVDEHYARLSGTSMATPHVAGAAALLAEQHPRWTGSQLKAVLSGTAHPVAGDADAVGAGRVDLARAVRQTLTAAQPEVHTFFRWPNLDLPARRLPITYTNAGSAAVTLNLALELRNGDGDPAPSGTAHLSTTALLVPAGESATVDLIATPAAGAAGRYTGTVTATAGDLVIRTPAAVEQEDERYDLTVHLRDRRGAEVAAGHGSTLVLGDAGDFYRVLPGGTARVQRGHYTVIGEVSDDDPGDLEARALMIAQPDVDITADRELALSVRQTVPVRAQIDRPGRTSGNVQIDICRENQCVLSFFDPQFAELYAGSVPGVRSGKFFLTLSAELERAATEVRVTSPARFPVDAQWYYQSPRRTGNYRLTIAKAGGGTVAELDAARPRGRAVLLDLPAATTAARIRETVQRVAAAGGRLVLLRFGSGASPVPDPGTTALPTIAVTGQGAAQLAEIDSAVATISTIPDSPDLYHLAYAERGSLPASMTYRVRTNDLARVHTRQYDAGEYAPRLASAWTVIDGRTIANSGVRLLPWDRDEYYLPGRWESANDSGYPGTPDMLIGGQTLRRGANPGQDWNKAVAGPGLAGTRIRSTQAWAALHGTTLDVAVPLLSDSGGHVRFADDLRVLNRGTGGTVLTHDGAVAGSNGTPGEGIFEVPNRSGRFELSASTAIDDPQWRTSTKVSVRWAFGIERDGPLPLSVVRFMPAVDPHNQARAGQVRVPIAIERQEGAAPARVRSLAVDVSYDDGDTWRAARVTRTGAGFVANVHNRPNGFISLRSRLSDSAGDTSDQTIIRAYHVR